MKNETAPAVCEGVKKIELLLTEAKEIFDSFPTAIKKSILNYHSETATMQYCLRWGLQAAKEIHEDWQTITYEYNTENGEGVNGMGNVITVHISNGLLFDKIQTLATEYSVSNEFLINAAIQRLVADIEFLRNLRAGEVTLK